MIKLSVQMYKSDNQDTKQSHYISVQASSY